MILRIFEMWFTSMDETFCHSASEEEEEDLWKVGSSTESSSVETSSMAGAASMALLS